MNTQEKVYKPPKIKYNIQVPGMALMSNAGLPIYSLKFRGCKNE